MKRMENTIDGLAYCPIMGDKMNYVRLDVGSTLHLCHRDTLTKFPHSTLAKLMSSQIDRRESEYDFIVIDRDGKHFATILNYLRDPCLLDLRHWHATALTELKGEANFYELTELLEAVEQRLELLVSQDYKVPNEFQFTTLLRSEDVERFLDQTKRPTFLVNSSVMMETKRFDAAKLVQRIDHKRFNVFFAPNSIRFGNIDWPDSLIVILHVPVVGASTIEISPPERGASLTEIYSYILRHHTNQDHLTVL